MTLVKHTRSDLTYRNLASQEIDTNEAATGDDPRLDEINEKVIAYMSITDPQDWNPSIWAIYKLIRVEKKNRQTLSSTKTSMMTTEELQRSMNL